MKKLIIFLIALVSSLYGQNRIIAKIETLDGKVGEELFRGWRIFDNVSKKDIEFLKKHKIPFYEDKKVYLSPITNFAGSKRYKKKIIVSSDTLGDPMYKYQKAIRVLGIDKIWERYPLKDTVVIAVIDDGLPTFPYTKEWGVIWPKDIDSSMFEFKGNYLEGNAIVDSSIDLSPYSSTGHSMDMCFTIAAVHNNGLGGKGILPAVKIHIYKVFNSSGWGYASGIIQAIKDAIEKDSEVKIINLSGDIWDYSQLVDDVLQELETYGKVFIVAGTDTYEYAPPDAICGISLGWSINYLGKGNPMVISVAWLDTNKRLPSNSKVFVRMNNLFAYIYTILPMSRTRYGGDDLYQKVWFSTSLSAATLTGIIGLYASTLPEKFDPYTIKEELLNTADVFIDSVTGFEYRVVSPIKLWGIDTTDTNGPPSGIISENGKEELKLYPNPTNSILTVEAPKSLHLNLKKIKMYNVIGQKVLEKAIKEERLTINMDTFPSGVYFIEFLDKFNRPLIRKKITLIK